MRYILLLLQFDGTDFHGWQMQKGDRTPQEVFGKAFEKLTGEKCTPRASSRTDSGVHARGLPVLINTETKIPLYGLQCGLNDMLPVDLAVVAATEVSSEFHVRRSASAKIYRYQIWNRASRAPLMARTSWNVRKALDIEAMQEAAVSLTGEHDYSAFRASSCQSPSTIRHITSIDVQKASAPLVTIQVTGNAFLQYMVRILVGTLVEVGRGHQSVDWPAKALESRDRKLAGPTAPPQGLCLHHVIYEPDPFT